MEPSPRPPCTGLQDGRTAEAGQGVGEDTHRGTTGDSTTAKEELILVYNYGGVPAWRDTGTQKTPDVTQKKQVPTAKRTLSPQGWHCGDQPYTTQHMHEEEATAIPSCPFLRPAPTATKICNAQVCFIKWHLAFAQNLCTSSNHFKMSEF